MMLYLGQQVRPDIPLYNMAMGFSLDGELNHRLLSRALQHCVDTSDALRTVFVQTKEVPQRVVLPSLSITTDQVELESHAAARQWMRRRTRSNFELDRLLLDSALIRISGGATIWYLNLHHLITDGWSLEIIYRRVAQFYQELLAGSELQTEFPAFEEYAQFERLERVDSEDPELGKAREHWAAQVATQTQPPRLYGAARRDQSTASTRLKLVLNHSIVKQLERTAERPEVRSFTRDQSLFTVFASLLMAWQFRASGQSKLALGAPAQNRVRKEFKQTIGVFIELFPLLATIEEQEAFATLMSRRRGEANVFLR